MFLRELTITRGYAYAGDAPKPLEGKVVLKGSTGSQEIVLSPMAIGRITACVAREVADTARMNAQQAARAMDSASNETALLGQLSGDVHDTI